LTPDGQPFNDAPAAQAKASGQSFTLFAKASGETKNNNRGESLYEWL
jgi:hypothetical protein